MNGEEMMALAAELWPICRSITGDGVRQTLQILGRHVPLQITEVSSGTSVLDWVVPDEWNIRAAWIADPSGRKIVDFDNNNLHVLQYSIPFRGRLPLAELQQHLFSLPDQPGSIPYRTSYYQKSWGFCLSQQQRDRLEDGEYEVCVDTTLQPGLLTYGEIFIPGKSAEEIFFSAHLCHPSLANDNLSGLLVAVAATQKFLQTKHRFSLRVLFAPATIGALTWLAQHSDSLSNIKHGLVLTGLGMKSALRYKRTVFGRNEIDQAVEYVFHERAIESEILGFSPFGYDERQYNSPGFRLPVGCLMRAPFGSYPEYHTDSDNLAFIHPDRLEEARDFLLEILNLLERNGTYQNLLPFGEPQLGSRGLYAPTPDQNLAQLWVLNLSDGRHSLLDIAIRSGIPFAQIAGAAELLRAGKLLHVITNPDPTLL